MLRNGYILPNEIFGMKRLFINIIIFSFFLLTLSWNGINAITSSSNFEIFTKDSTPYGIPYSQWIEKWWTWWAGIPANMHPTKNFSDPERCSVMQDGPVWFIPDVVPGVGKISYNCNVPQGKAILLPITTTFCEKAIKGTCGTITTDSELAESANNILTPIRNMQVTVDGVNVDLSGLPVKTDFFSLTFPKDPVEIWGKIEPGTYRTLATGHFLFLHDLSPGKHEIDLRVVDLLKGNEGPPPRFDPMREGSFVILMQ